MTPQNHLEAASLYLEKAENGATNQELNIKIANLHINLAMAKHTIPLQQQNPAPICDIPSADDMVSEQQMTHRSERLSSVLVNALSENVPNEDKDNNPARDVLASTIINLPPRGP